MANIIDSLKDHEQYKIENPTKDENTTYFEILGKNCSISIKDFGKDWIVYVMDSSGNIVFSEIFGDYDKAQNYYKDCLKHKDIKNQEKKV